VTLVEFKEHKNQKKHAAILKSIKKIHVKLFYAEIEIFVIDMKWQNQEYSVIRFSTKAFCLLHQE